jgi:hypothetical protein
MRFTKSVLFFLVIIFSGCSKEQLLESRLQGTWKIDIYTKTIYQDNTPLLSESSSFSDVGTFEFKSNGKGSYNLVKDLGYGAYSGYGEFTWTNTASSVTIYQTGSNKIFQVVTNSSNRIELEHIVENFYLPGHSSEFHYSLDEFISLVK